MITREQVADLRPGDVVEVTHEDWPKGTVVRGPLWMVDGETLQVSRIVVRHWDGRHPFDEGLTLAVVSRVPRLYVNSDRTEPVPGDVVRDEEADCLVVLLRTKGTRYPDKWVDSFGQERTYDHLTPARRLRLLVDGETGRCVP